MADPEVNPYAKYKGQPGATPAPAGAVPVDSAPAPQDDNPYAKYKAITVKPVDSKPAPGVLEDMAKTTLPSLARGGLGLITTPRTISDLSGAATNYVANKIGTQGIADAANRFHNWDSGIGQAFPSYGSLKGEVERDLTGPMYEAKTGPGHLYQKGLEIAPSLLAGGEGVIPSLAKSAGSAVGSETLKKGAEAVKNFAPSVTPDWLVPAAEAVGGMLGTGLPAAARRVVTPLPMTDQRLATVNALRQTNPELVNASTAGQLTESPRVMSMEARSPRMADLPQRQAEGYTRGVMRQAGSGGMFDRAGLNEANATGNTIEVLRNAHNMTPTEFAALNRDVASLGARGSPLYRAVGPGTGGAPGNPTGLATVRDAIRNGPGGGNPMPLNMTGQRYGALKQIIQGAKADTSHEQQAINRVGGMLDERFMNSMPPDDAARLRDLYQQYSNYKTISDIPMKAGGNTLTPQQVHAKAPVNSALETHADQAASVMRPLPKPGETGNVAPIVGSALGAATSGVLSHFLHLPSEGVVSAILAGERAGNALAASKNIASRVVANPTIQGYLKNQRWRPEPNTAPPDMASLVRVLAAPSEGPRMLNNGGGNQ